MVKSGSESWKIQLPSPPFTYAMNSLSTLCGCSLPWIKESWDILCLFCKDDLDQVSWTDVSSCSL